MRSSRSIRPWRRARSIATAAKLVESLHAWNVQRVAGGEQPVAVRIGVNTGRAFVGDIGSDRRVDYTVLGNTVNVAARLESAVAGPNEVVVGEETARPVLTPTRTATFGSPRRARSTFHAVRLSMSFAAAATARRGWSG